MDATTDSSPPDSMVEIARVISASEASTLAAMFDADGIICHIGGWWHHSIWITAIGIGGFRLSVPRAVYEDASALIRSFLAEPISAEPFYAQRRRVVRLLAVVAAMIGAPGTLAMFGADRPLPTWELLLIPVSLASIAPVPPQGSGDYYLAAKSTA